MNLFWNKLVRPALFAMDAERAHELAMRAVAAGLSPFAAGELPAEDAELLETSCFGLTFPNPLGLAAGFDKNGVVVDQMASLGFGFVEVGTVTYMPQPGNPKPRLFRLPDDRALINRLGFNNSGAQKVAGRLSRLLPRRTIIGINIGRNKDVENEKATENYLSCFDVVRAEADYVTINVSSPNTPGLRALQDAEHLDLLLGALREREQDGERRLPLLVKVAPDLSEQAIESVVEIALRHRFSGIIATNTTISRGGLITPGVDAIGAGGLSGRPLAARSTEVIKTIYGHAKGRLPIVGVGGIFDAEDAFAKIAAGASLLQAYTGFVYGGPSFARKVNSGLAAILRNKGFSSVSEAVGTAIEPQNHG